MLTDPDGRTIEYLRLSLTDKCHMRCVYCRPEMDMGMPGAGSLTAEEIEQLVRHLVRAHGLRKVRLTGGEPTIRPDLLEIIQRLAAIDGIEDLALTTNGLTLPKQARSLAAAGLKRVNVSIDSLDRQRFAEMTGVDGLDRVLAGIVAARDAGLDPIKLNTVIVRGENEAEIPGLARFAAREGLVLRFIELMPMGPLAHNWSERFVAERDMWALLDPILRRRTPQPHIASAARYHDVVLDDGGRVRLGFITAMSCPFCDSCNRLRVTSDGAIYPCLFGESAGSLLDALRPRFDPAALDQALRNALRDKAPEHGVTGLTIMTHIGG